MRRLVRILLVMLLVPVVAFGNPGTAAAATATKTDYVGANWEFTGLGVGGMTILDASCGGSFAMSRDSIGNLIMHAGQGYCVGMLDVTPGLCQVIEPDCTRYTITFEGPNCDGIVMAPEVREHDKDGFGTTASGWGSATALAGGCDPTQACLGVGNTQRDDNMISMGRECESLDLDPPGPVAPDSSCQYGTVSTPRVETTKSYNGDLYGWFARTALTVKTKTAVPELEAPTSPGFGTQNIHWRSYIVGKYTTEAGTFFRALDFNKDTFLKAEGRTVIEPGVGMASPMQAGARVPDSELNLGGTTQVGEGAFRGSVSDEGIVEIVGAGVYLNRSGAMINEIPTGSQAENGRGLYGVTDSGACSWYWGDKLWNDADSSRDEPLGGLQVKEPEPPPPGEEPTEPVEPDPQPPTDDDIAPEDDLGWLALVVQLLRTMVTGLGKILAAIGGLGDAIASAIEASLIMLLIPDALAMGKEVGELVDAWEDTSLYKWGAAFTGQRFDMPGNGCAGLPVTIPLPNIEPVSMNFGAACSGTIATAAGVVKIAATAGLVIFGALGCLRALGSGFGWSPGVGKGGDS